MRTYRILIFDYGHINASDVIEAEDDATEAFRMRIASREIAALLRRCAAILDEPVLPEMYEDYRCVPWPMI